jgi:hypothetical protein
MPSLISASIEACKAVLATLLIDHKWPSEVVDV